MAKDQLLSHGRRGRHCLGAWLAIPALASLLACGAVESRPQGEGGGESSAGSSDSASGGSGPGSSGGARSGNAGSSADPLATPPNLDEPLLAESAGELGLRRLTAREYENTLSDLLPGADIAEASAIFPSDELSSNGYRSSDHFLAPDVESLIDAAEAIADSALRLGLLPTSCDDSSDAAQASSCATEFILTFGRRAFRRPVTAEEAADLLAVHGVAVELGFTFRESLAQLVSAMLQSPNFLYHWEQGDETPTEQGGLLALTPHQIASRLSYLLWQTMPDEPLLSAADAGELSTPEQVLAQAGRLLDEPTRAEMGLANFHEQWLRVDELAELQKDGARYPVFTPAVAQALERELPKFVGAVFSGDGSLETLLTAPYAYVNQASAPLYGATSSSDELERIELPSAERAGVLTQASFLAKHAGATVTHPMERGSVVLRRLLCGELPPGHPGGEDVVPLGGDNLTNREKYEAQNANPSCVTCHRVFDSLGFAFENYDPIGAYQTTDNGKPVDASGEALTPLGANLRFTNAIDLVTQLAGHDEVKWCTTRQWFRFALGRMETIDDLGSMQRAYRAGSAVPEYSMRDVLMALVQSKTFRYRAPPVD